MYVYIITCVGALCAQPQVHGTFTYPTRDSCMSAAKVVAAQLETIARVTAREGGIANSDIKFTPMCVPAS